MFIKSYQIGHEPNEMDINRGMINNISNVGGELGLIPKRYAELTESSSPFGIYNIKNKKVLDMLNVKYIMDSSTKPISDPTLKLAFTDNKVNIYLNI